MLDKKEKDGAVAESDAVRLGVGGVCLVRAWRKESLCAASFRARLNLYMTEKSRARFGRCAHE